MLFPRPRQIVEQGHGPAPGALDVRVEHDASLAPEGYRLDIGPHGVLLAHRDERGLGYGRATLDQLVDEYPDGLPGIKIRDWPDFPIRGYMLDVSRDRVDRETLTRLVDLCSVARINHFELYTEHTFAYTDHEVVWHDASPMTADDIRWLDASCAARGIELVANQNCFGHMGRWLAHEPYRRRAEAPDGFEPIPGYRMAPTVLAPTAENAAFAHTLFAELLPNFRSRRVNVNCDETFDLGHGVSKELVARVGKERVYVDHLRRIMQPLVDNGYTVHYWADIVRKEPAFAHHLPDGAVPVCWTYEAPRTPGDGAAPLDPAVRTLLDQLGVDLDAAAGFDVNTRPLADAGVPFWVAPGTSGWDSLIGRVDNALANLLDAARTGHEREAAGYLITDWGDNGHLQPPSVSFGPIAYGGAAAWCADANSDIDVSAVLDHIVFGDRSGRLGGAIVELGRQWKQTGRRTFNGSPLQTALLPGFSFATGEPSADAVENVIDNIDACVQEVEMSTPDCTDGTVVRDELVQAARLARHGAWRLLASVDGRAPSTDQLRADLAEAIDHQRSVWLCRARPGGLADSVARLEATLAGYGP